VDIDVINYYINQKYLDNLKFCELIALKGVSTKKCVTSVNSSDSYEVFYNNKLLGKVEVSF